MTKAHLQWIVLPILTASIYLPNQFARKLLKEDQKFAKKPPLVQKIVFQQNIVQPKINVKPRKNNNRVIYMNLISKLINFIYLATCISTSDCSHQKTKTVCKESSQTGKKTCNKPSNHSCKSVCADGEYCAGKNICKNGR